MFENTVEFYDAIYEWKDFAGEAEKVREILDRYRRTDERSLLDMACGTGQHLEHLREHYEAIGVDLDPHMVTVARERNPGVHFETGSLVDFDLGKRFGAIVCLFGSIGYAKSLEATRSALRAFARHLEPGGVVLIEPWLTPGVYVAGKVHVLNVDREDLKITRMNLSEQDGRLSIMEMHHLIGTSEGVRHVADRHVLFMATKEEMEEAFTATGLEVTHDEVGLNGRGLFIGRRPLE